MPIIEHMLQELNILKQFNKLNYNIQILQTTIYVFKLILFDNTTYKSKQIIYLHIGI